MEKVVDKFVEKSADSWSICFDRFLIFKSHDGKEIRTSPIIKIDMIQRKVFTESGSVYNLGEIDPRYSDDIESAFSFYRTSKSNIILVE